MDSHTDVKVKGLHPIYPQEPHLENEDAGGRIFREAYAKAVSEIPDSERFGEGEKAIKAGTTISCDAGGLNCEYMIFSTDWTSGTNNSSELDVRLATSGALEEAKRLSAESAAFEHLYFTGGSGSSEGMLGYMLDEFQIALKQGTTLKRIELVEYWPDQYNEAKRVADQILQTKIEPPKP